MGICRKTHYTQTFYIQLKIMSIVLSIDSFCRHHRMFRLYSKIRNCIMLLFWRSSGVVVLYVCRVQYTPYPHAMPLSHTILCVAAGDDMDSIFMWTVFRNDEEVSIWRTLDTNTYLWQHSTRTECRQLWIEYLFIFQASH